MNAPDTTSNRSLTDSADQKVTSEAPKQCDFYENPTVLSRLILNQKYASALRRLKNYPEEASVWVCSKRNPFKTRDGGSSHRSLVSRPSMRRLNSKLDPQLLDYSIRQLPIHVACNSLFRCSDSQKADVERLITHLAVMYPAGCEQPDHEGKLPLHEALWHNASPPTLSVLLMASPSTLHERDKYGRTPMELNRSRTGEHKEQVKDMLMRGIAYWESARAEAVTLTKQGDDQNILKNISMRLQKGASVGDVGDESVEPMTWEKLEQRALYLEQLLSDMYEKNYELGEHVDRLTNEKMQLQDTVDRLQDETHSKEAGSEETVKDLCEELDFLRREISRLKKQLKKKNKANAEEGVFDADAVRYLEWSNETLQNELQEMTERNRENEVRLARLEIVATKLRKKLKESEGRAAEPESTGMEKEKDVDNAREDFMDLLAMLSHQSPLATERFLAEKVIRLEAQLGEASRSSELSSAASFQESERLIRENVTLQKKVQELSTGVDGMPPASVVKGRTKASRQGKKKTAKANPYTTDSLDDILHQAAGLYSEELSSSKELAFSCFPDPPKDEGDTLNREAATIFPSSAFPNDSSLQAIEESSGTDTWNSSHVKLLDAYGASADTKKESVTEPRRLKLVEIASQGSEVVSRVPSRTGPYSSSDGTERDGSFTISEVSMDSLIRSKRSLRPRTPASSKSDSSSSLMRIPADVIVAMRTASFSTEASGDIETLLKETETVLGRPIPNDVKGLIRAKYQAEGGDLSKLLLAWLKEALGDSEGSIALSIDDLTSIFAGADKIAEQMISADEEELTISGDTTDNEQVVSEDVELSPLPASEDSSENTSSVVRRQWASAFEETARYVSERRLTRSPSIPTGVEPSSRFNPDLVSADDMNQIIADASNIYSLPLISSRVNRSNAAVSGTEASNAPGASQATQRSSQNTSVSNTNSLIDDLIRDYKSKYS